MLTLFVTCVGVIMGYLLYMNRQLSRLNDTVNTQQTVLSTLITDIKASNIMGGGVDQCGASPIALSVAKLASEGDICDKSENGSDSSDDEDSSDEDSSDDESVDEPVKDKPTTNVTDEPVTDEPTKEEPTKDEPTKEEPTKEEPTKEEPDVDTTSLVKPEKVDEDTFVIEQIDMSSTSGGDQILYMGGLHAVSMDELGPENIKKMMSGISGLMTENVEIVPDTDQDIYDLDTDEVDNQTDMSTMKVAELRTIVTNKIGPVANISKLKKNELLELLDQK
jgi:hypothetical protein